MFKLKRLANGLPFIHKEMPGTGIVDVRLTMRAGALYDKALSVPPGTAHFLEHIVHEKTEKYENREDILNIVARKGGQRNASTYVNEKMRFFATVLKEEAESAAEYVSQLTMHAILTPDATEKHRLIIMQECLDKMKQPDMKAWCAFRKSIFEGTGLEFTALGDVDSISRISLEDMRIFYDKRFNADNSLLTIYGDIDEAAAADLALRYFAPMRAGAGADRADGALFAYESCPEAEARLSSAEKKFAFVEIPDEQAVAYFGGVTRGRSAPGRFAMMVLMQILSGDPTSILYRILRDERHLLYHVGHAVFNADTFGTFAFVLNIAPQNIQQSIDVIKAEVARIAAGEVSDDKVSLAKTRIKAHEIFANQSVQNQADSDASTLILYPEFSHPDQWIARLESVTKEEIIAQAVYIADHLNILAVCANKREEYDF